MIKKEKGMKFARIMMMALAVLVLTGSANALITFDEFPMYTVVTDQYAAQNVMFAGVTGSAPILYSDAGLSVLSPNPPYAGDFRMDFINPVTWVEFDSGFWNNVGAGIIQVYDPDLNLLTQVTNQFTYEDLGYNYEHFSFYGLGQIGTVYFSSVNDPYGAAIDNLDFSPAVPEPATIALFGLGLLGLGARLRKR